MNTMNAKSLKSLDDAVSEAFGQERAYDFLAAPYRGIKEIVLFGGREVDFEASQPSLSAVVEDTIAGTKHAQTVLGVFETESGDRAKCWAHAHSPAVFLSLAGIVFVHSPESGWAAA